MMNILIVGAGRSDAHECLVRVARIAALGGACGVAIALAPGGRVSSLIERSVDESGRTSPRRGELRTCSIRV
jgi:hypothetical protein